MGGGHWQIGRDIMFDNRLALRYFLVLGDIVVVETLISLGELVVCFTLRRSRVNFGPSGIDQQYLHQPTIHTGDYRTVKAIQS